MKSSSDGWTTWILGLGTEVPERGAIIDKLIFASVDFVQNTKDMHVVIKMRQSLLACGGVCVDTPLPDLARSYSWRKAPKDRRCGPAGICQARSRTRSWSRSLEVASAA